MAPLLIAAITPDEPGFSALRAESLAQNLNMLGRLAENWQSGKNRFDAPGEKLLGAFAHGQLVGVCGLNIDPFSQQVRAGRIRHLYIGESHRRQGIGHQLLADDKRACYSPVTIFSSAPGRNDHYRILYFAVCRPASRQLERYRKSQRR